MIKRPINIKVDGDISECVVLQTKDNISRTFPLEANQPLGTVIYRAYNTDLNFDTCSEVKDDSVKRAYRFSDATTIQHYNFYRINYNFIEWDI